MCPVWCSSCAYAVTLAARFGVGSSVSLVYVFGSCKKSVPSRIYCSVSMTVIFVPLSAVLIIISLLFFNVLMALRSSGVRLDVCLSGLFVWSWSRLEVSVMYFSSVVSFVCGVM